jgi:D-sedoheptulose 7-phosphate isomerase
MMDRIRASIKDSMAVKEAVLKGSVGQIESAAKMIIASIRSSGKVLVFGNGGSAADSQHIAAELVGRFKKERKAIAAVSLTTDTSILTALGNDYGYQSIFSRQVEALGRPGDVAIGISTSGNSPNVIAALQAARSLGMKTIGMTGKGGGGMSKLCDLLIAVPSSDTPRVQESHIMIAHIICDLVESEIST